MLAPMGKVSTSFISKEDMLLTKTQSFMKNFNVTKVICETQSLMLTLQLIWQTDNKAVMWIRCQIIMEVADIIHISLKGATCHGKNIEKRMLYFGILDERKARQYSNFCISKYMFNILSFATKYMLIGWVSHCSNIFSMDEPWWRN